MRYLKTILTAAALTITGTAHAENTDIMVRAISADAKFIGTSMGGVQLILRDARTGEILAEGTTSGGTGDTAAIMDAKGRSPARVAAGAGGAEGAAGYLATIDIGQPTLVELEARGPLDRPKSESQVTARRWVMPGEDIVAGDGWVVEMPGLAITIGSLADQGELAIDAKVELLCGCPITPGGLWDADDYLVTASLWQEGVRTAEVPLPFVKAPGEFAGSLSVPHSGHYRLVIHARNLVTGNSGVAETTLSIKEKY